MASSALNKNNSAVKRIMQEARELANDPCTDYCAAPLEDDIFEWHCTLRGPAGTDFEGGLYHFRIILPAEYPFRPPSIMMLTPNGRFELNSKICISFTNYHEELWQPAWGVRTAILGLQGFFPLKGQAAVGVGSIEYPASERRRLAALSRDWTCPHCEQRNLELLPDPTPPSSPETSTENTAAASALDSDGSNVAEELSTDLSTTSRQPSHTVEPSDTNSEPESVVQSIDTIMTTSASSGNSHGQSPFLAHQPPIIHAAHVTHMPTHKAPVLLDTTICVLLVLAMALVFRRVF